MKSIHFHLLLISFLSLSACQSEQEATVPETGEAETVISLHDAEPVTDIDRLMSNIIELSSDEYGGDGGA